MYLYIFIHIPYDYGYPIVWAKSSQSTFLLGGASGGRGESRGPPRLAARADPTWLGGESMEGKPWEKHGKFHGENMGKWEIIGKIGII